MTKMLKLIVKQADDTPSQLRRFCYNAAVRECARINKISAGSVRIARDNSNKPYFPEYKETFFNISLTEAAAAVALSDLPVGVDIEKITPICLPVSRHMFSPDEFALLAGILDPTLRNKTFLALWTRKEAYSKMEGNGLQKRTDSYSVLKPPISSYLSTYCNEAYVLSICRMSALSDEPRPFPEITDESPLNLVPKKQPFRLFRFPIERLPDN